MPNRFIDKETLASGVSGMGERVPGADATGLEDLISGSAEVASSDDSRRKRRGLAIFAVLLGLTLACAVAFFMSSRHLSIAASIVDETVGTMESYTVVVFKGTVEEEVAAADKVTTSGNGTSESLSSLPPSNTMQEAFTSDPGKDDDRGFAISDFIMSLFARASKQTEADAEKLFVSDINDIYSSKGAQTLTINLETPEKYAEPVIFDKGGKKVAVMSIDHYISRVKLTEVTKGLRSDGADFIIAIAPRTEMVSTFDNIDTCIVTSSQSEIEDRAKRNSLVVVSPSVEEVGALIITSNNIANLKTIKEI